MAAFGPSHAQNMGVVTEEEEEEFGMLVKTASGGGDKLRTRMEQQSVLFRNMCFQTCVY